MDIEGHEPYALRGIGQIIANSPNVKILFEKMGKRPRRDDDLDAFFQKQGMNLFGVGPNSTLAPLKSGELAAWNGDMFAARPGIAISKTFIAVNSLSTRGSFGRRWKSVRGRTPCCFGQPRKTSVSWAILVLEGRALQVENSRRGRWLAWGHNHGVVWPSTCDCFHGERSQGGKLCYRSRCDEI